MTFPVDLSLLHDVNHMPALPVLERSMRQPSLRLHDFCIPVNSYFPTAEMMGELKSNLGDVLRYYPSDNQSISKCLGDFLEMDPAHLVVANGSTELISWINDHFITKNLVTDVPTFGRWTDNARELGRRVYPFFRDSRHSFQLETTELVRFVRQCDASALAICNPNNPSGALMSPHEILSLLDQLEDLDIIVVDESFIDFACQGSIPSVAEEIIHRKNAVVIKSLGKNLGLHGVRCGYAVANKALATKIRRLLPPWNVNSLAEEFIRLMPLHQKEYEIGRRNVVRDSQVFQARLDSIDGITALPTHANFVFCELDQEISGTRLRDELLMRWGCFIRECGSKIGSSSRYLRIATRPSAQQTMLVGALKDTIDVLRESSQHESARRLTEATTTRLSSTCLPSCNLAANQANSNACQTE